MITAVNSYDQQKFSISFSGKKLKAKKLTQKILESIKKDNLLGKGNDSKAYVYAENSNFVILVPRGFNRKQIDVVDFQPVKGFKSDFNYGQTVLTSNNGIRILKRVFGKEHSFHNWLDSIARFDRMPKIPLGEARGCLYGLKKICEFPLESYLNLARKIKFLNENGKVVDCINPNNVLVDHRKKQFFIIDLWDRGKHGNSGVSGADHMITLLLDGLLHGKLLKSLPSADVLECKKISRIIINKCLKAAEIIKLPRTKDEITNVFTDCDGKYHHNLVGRYNVFNKIYNL